MWQTIWLQWSFCVRKGVLWWLWWLKGLASTCKLGQGCSQNGKHGRAAGCKRVLKKQEDNCPHKWQSGWLLEYCQLCGCHCQRRWLPCESQRELLVQHLQPLDIVKEGGYNGGLLVAANNHCLMSKFGKFGNHHCWQRSKRSCHWSL
jgi:hypothetical protein